MKRFFTLIIFLGCAGYFVAHFNQSTVVVDSVNDVKSSNQKLLQDKNLQQAFATIVRKEKEHSRTPASQNENVYDDVKIEGSDDEVVGDDIDVEYDSEGLTSESVKAEITDAEIKIKYLRMRREEHEATLLEKKVARLKKHLEYLPDN